MPASVADSVSARLESFLQRMREEAVGYGPEGLRLTESAASAMHGGKRLRARFCRAGWSAIAGGATAEPDALWGICAALEVFQGAALVHDDLIDNSDTRRGRPAAHRALESVHREERWAGDAEAFGRSSAVLLGDLLVAWSDDLLEEALRGHQRADAVRAEYAQMRRGVTVGQFLDIAEESAWVTSPIDEHAERALRVALLKSARYSIEQPLALGALLAGADAEQLTAVREFGRQVGLAFQLRDDLLGVFGDAAVTGKPAGDDLREGKRTLLIAYTREASTPAARDELDRQLGDRRLTGDEVARLQELIETTGAPQRIETLITEYTARADRALDAARLDADAVDELRALATAAVARTA